MPQTVPNRPMNGAVLEHVASTEKELCRRDSSEATPWRAPHVVNDNFGRVAEFLGAVEFRHAFLGHGIQRGSRIRAEHLNCFAEVCRLFKTGDACSGFALGRTEQNGFLDDKTPAADRHDEKDKKNALGHKARVGNH